MPTIAKLKSVHLPLAAALFLSASCSEAPTGPTQPPAATQSVEVHAGRLDPLGTSSEVFSLNSASTVQLMLAGAVAEGPTRSISPMLRLGLGQGDAATGACSPTPIQEFDLEPRLTAALQRFLEPGTYCISATDVGALTEPVTVVLRVTAPALVRTDEPAGTHVFENTITPGGRATRTFGVGSVGDVSVTLNSLTGGSVEVTLGIGLLDVAGTCHLAKTMTTTPGGAPLVARAEAGWYCAVIHDATNNVIGQQSFSMTIAHP